MVARLRAKRDTSPNSERHVGRYFGLTLLAETTHHVPAGALDDAVAAANKAAKGSTHDETAAAHKLAAYLTASTDRTETTVSAPIPTPAADYNVYSYHQPEKARTIDFAKIEIGGDPALLAAAANMANIIAAQHPEHEVRSSLVSEALVVWRFETAEEIQRRVESQASWDAQVAARKEAEAQAELLANA